MNPTSGDAATPMNSVLMNSGSLPEGVHIEVRGYDFNNGINFDEIMKSCLSTGIQSTNLAYTIDVINQMIESREKPLNPDEDNSNLNPVKRQKRNCTIFLGYTSNMISSGIRETIRYLAEHNLVDVIVTSAGGIEEDFIKCFKPSYIGDFTKFDDAVLRKSGMNRIGNMIVPNENYVSFEDWVTPILDQMLVEQTEQGVNWTPSKLIERLGREIDNKESVYYWCARNGIPVFCPALTDGSLGDMIFFHHLRSGNEGSQLRVDIAEDIVRLNKQAVLSSNTGMIILGGGVVKHQIANANLMRNGADFSVYINTGNEFEASDSGAPPSEAVSWGKIREGSVPVKLHAEVSLVFPLIVAQTFARLVEARKVAERTEAKHE